MKVFGPKPWGPALHTPGIYVGPLLTAGRKCLWCDEEVTMNEAGVVMPSIVSWMGPPTVGGEVLAEVEMVVEHRECWLRGMFGSVGHQRRRCSCYGGTEEDPPGLTRREAAQEAVDLWETMHPQDA